MQTMSSARSDWREPGGVETAGDRGIHSDEGSEDYKKALAFIDGIAHQVPLSSGNVFSRSEQYVIV